MNDRYPRWQKENIQEAMTSRRVLLLSGVRQYGKTTLAKELVDEDTEYRTLDDLSLKQAAENDPHGFVKHGKRTLIIDEVQRVPNLQHGSMPPMACMSCGTIEIVNSGRLTS